jgi:hypothetical protein
MRVALICWINYEDSNSKSDSKGITWTADDVKEAKRKLK